ncbi:hypothetical protein RDWZM_002659 [Blomia tropicalis]|uniref:Uncharacterized protein n=1 Tax=Blomia tropicalis TaxID=40697 RepID=A0A9Q0ME60_BLOTA|nr:hypothetical protein BLOT_001498 [Blomia tropicalis]KAJ6224114.1 hypothetical protein RDWZM_002659 [Blomia tropicalis]
MCAALTENVVLVRTRCHDLKSVRKLNCWGCALKDVSIVHRMPNVEVISLSINSIDTLENFASCTLLQELYLRKNEIKDINEILHLSQLQYLKKLSLEDNPCTSVDNYRFTVLKTLPNLEYLDNVRVTPDEIYQAEKTGRDLIWPGSGGVADVADLNGADNDLNDDIEYTTTANGVGNQHHRVSHHESQISLSNQLSSSNNLYHGTASEVSYSTENVPEVVQATQSNANQSSSSSSVFQSNVNGSVNRNSGSQFSYSNGTNGRETNVHTNGNCTKSKTNMAKSNSLSDYNLYHNETYRNTSPPPLSAQHNYEPSEYSYEGNASNGSVNSQAQVYGSTPNNFHPHNQNGSTRNIPSSASSQQRLLPKGGKNRNANILSAVLCLIKELDYGSLEVVDTTIHCRMEEMED